MKIVEGDELGERSDGENTITSREERKLKRKEIRDRKAARKLLLTSVECSSPLGGGVEDSLELELGLAQIGNGDDAMNIDTSVSHKGNKSESEKVNKSEVKNDTENENKEEGESKKESKKENES